MRRYFNRITETPSGLTENQSQVLKEVYDVLKDDPSSVQLIYFEPRNKEGRIALETIEKAPSKKDLLRYWPESKVS